jgi:precorrin-3B methylase
VLDDAVDEVIEAALKKGTRVAFVSDGDLAIHDRIGLVLRY